MTVASIIIGGSSGAAFTAGGDLSGDNTSQTLINIQGKALSTSLASVGASQDGYSLTWVNSAGEWQAKPPSGSGFAAGGDLSGTSSSQTVIRINGATVPAAGALTTGHVLQANGASSTTYGYVANANIDAAAGIAYSKLNLASSIVNADVSASAGIAGTKISPDFGSQDITTTGILTVGTNPATQGTLRLQGGNSYVLVTRNAANTSDMIWLQQDGANNMTIGTTSGNNIQLQTGGTLTMYRSGTAVFDYSNTVISNYLPVRFTATNPAASGTLRLGNNPGIVMAQRNSGNTADMPLLAASTTELFLGTNTAFTSQMGNIRLYGSGTVYMGTGSTTVAAVDSTNGLGLASTYPLVLGLAANPAGAGRIRIVNNPGTTLAMRNAANSADLVALALNTTDGYIGCDTSFSNALSNLGIGPATINSKATTSIYSGNAKVTITETIGNVQTTDATVTTAASGTIPTGISTYDAIVTAVKSDNSQGATYKRAITFRNNAGTVATIGAVTDNGTFEDDSTWDCTIDNSTTTWRVRVTGKATTTIQWHVVVRRSEGIA